MLAAIATSLVSYTLAERPGVPVAPVLPAAPGAPDRSIVQLLNVPLPPLAVILTTNVVVE